MCAAPLPEPEATPVRTSQRRHEVCGATILIRRWIYGLNHRRIISDSRALLPPTETYACLFADNCTQRSTSSFSLRPLSLRARLSPALVLSRADMTDLPPGISI